MIHDIGPSGIAAGKHQGAACENWGADPGERFFGKCAHQGWLLRRIHLAWRLSLQSGARPPSIVQIGVFFILLVQQLLIVMVNQFRQCFHTRNDVQKS